MAWKSDTHDVLSMHPETASGIQGDTRSHIMESQIVVDTHRSGGRTLRAVLLGPHARVMPDASIPVIDLGLSFAGVPGALQATAAAWRNALETIGFFTIINHEIAQAFIDRTFGEAKMLWPGQIHAASRPAARWQAPLSHPIF